MRKIAIRTMAQREYRMIPVDQIRVVVDRARKQGPFAVNVRSLKLGAYFKPILVNKRHLAETGRYDLICGEGRLTAHKQLGKTHIIADVWDVDDATAYRIALSESHATPAPPYVRTPGDLRAAFRRPRRQRRTTGRQRFGL